MMDLEILEALEEIETCTRLLKENELSEDGREFIVRRLVMNVSTINAWAG